VRQRLVLLFALALLVSFTSGCYSTTTQAKKVPTWVMMNTMASGQVIAPYERSYTQWYVLWGLVPIGSPSVQEDIAAEIKAKGAKYMDSVQVDTGMKFPWVLVNIVTNIITVQNQKIIVTGNLKK
jgi:Mg/Co/Ni transporter MgtE